MEGGASPTQLESVAETLPGIVWRRILHRDGRVTYPYFSRKAEQLLGYFRDVLACLVGCQSELMLHTTAAERPTLEQLGKQLGLETLLAIAQILDQTLTRLRQSTHVRTLVELARKWKG